MKPFARPRIDAGNLDWEFYLDLPNGDDFVSKTAPVDPATVIVWCESLLPYFNTIPGLAERRLSEKCREPFVLRGGDEEGAQR